MNSQKSGREKRLKVFSYVRVSSDEQAEGGSLDEQRRVIRDFCERRGHTIVGEIEDVQTAAKSGRQPFGWIVKELRKGKGDGVVFHKVDRSSRNYRDWLTISDLMDEGLYIAFAAEGLESNDASGRFTMDILAATAVHYIRNLKGEIKKGLRGRIMQGLWPWRAPLGYLDASGLTRKDRRHRRRLEPKRPNPELASLIKELFVLYATGNYTLEALSIEMASRGLVAPNGKPLDLRRISEILANPFYAGLLSFEDQLFSGKHLPLIEMSLWRRVQELRQQKMHAMVIRHQHLLQQLLTCGHCQRPLTPEIQKGHTYYRCHTKSHEPTCIREEAVTVPIREIIRGLRLTPEEKLLIGDVMSKLRKTEEQEGKEVRQRLVLEKNKVVSRRERAVQGFLSGVFNEDTYKQYDAELLVAEKEADEQLAQLATVKTSEILAKAMTVFERLHVAYLSANEEKQRELLRRVCSNLVVTGKNVMVEPRRWLAVALRREGLRFGGPMGI